MCKSRIYKGPINGTNGFGRLSIWQFTLRSLAWNGTHANASLGTKLGGGGRGQKNAFHYTLDFIIKYYKYPLEND